MSEISDAIQTKCLAFGDRIIKLNDYLLKEAANKKPSFKIVKGNEYMRNQYQYICNQYDTYLSLLVIPLSFLVILVISCHFSN